MGVSYKLLYEEEEPQAISVDMTRACIELPKADAEQTAKKRATMPLQDIAELVFSYKSLIKIENLWGLDRLVKLKLDCNGITKIENLDHLTSLTWLDLSFNNITRIEGLDTLVNLTDLSLLDNKISELEGLDNLKKLQCLSLGKNNLNKLDRMLYLRRFECLEAVSLAGNPLCREANYKSYMCSHIKGIKYLDYVRVKAEDITTAMEQHQDEMLDLKEKEELGAEEDKAAAAAAEQAQLMDQANLKGVDTLFEDLTKDDPDWAKLTQVPGLTDGWQELHDKWGLEKDTFCSSVLEHHSAKQAELQRWRDAVKAVCDEKDAAAKGRVLQFEKQRKLAVRQVHDEGARAADVIPSIKTQLTDLKRYLMSLELTTVEALDELLATFDSRYSTHAEAAKRAMMAFFATVRELQNSYNASLITQAQKLQEEKFALEASEDMDALQEEARHLAADKDALLAALQAVHELRAARLDTLEDTLVNTEGTRTSELVAKHADWAYMRNRDRVVEIVAYTERNAAELEALMHDEEEDD